MAKHVSSEAITSIMEHLQKNALQGPNGIETVKAQLPETEIGFPYFGMVGAPLAMQYGTTREAATTAMDEIRETIQDYIAELKTARDTWIKAEDANTVVTK
jgi:hypothetical protein